MVRFARAGLLVAALVMLLSIGAAGMAGAGSTRWGVPGGKLGGGFSPPRHNGEDVLQKKGAVIRALHRGCVFRVDNSVQGYKQEITVRYEPKAGMKSRYVLYGHVLKGSQRKKGSCFKRGAVLAKIGSKADALGTPPHAHVQVWKKKADALYYRNGEAMDPAPVRRKYGEL